VLLSLLGEANELLADLIPGILILGWPVALGIAILRYRLYDIDRLINRTLVYGLLTALLAGVYAGAVLALGARSSAGWAEILRAGRWPWRPWRVAALVRPARRRVQAVVDRRFNRASTTRPGPSRRSAANSATS
jgi:hypothetical protein